MASPRSTPGRAATTLSGRSGVRRSHRRIPAPCRLTGTERLVQRLGEHRLPCRRVGPAGEHGGGTQAVVRRALELPQL
eukprot:2310342-Lingulodinium_polyedra.AAC.1